MANFRVIHEVVLGTRKAKFGDGQNELRCQVWEAESPAGPRRGLNIREWWQNDQGEWCPGKDGVSVRSGELAAVQAAIAIALGQGGSGAPAQTHASTSAPREAKPAQRAPQALYGRDSWRHIASSKYASTCALCSRPYGAGEAVGFDPEGVSGRKGAHWRCVEKLRGIPEAEPDGHDPTADWGDSPISGPPGALLQHAASTGDDADLLRIF